MGKKNNRPISQQQLDHRRDLVKKILLKEEMEKVNKRLGLFFVLSFFIGGLSWEIIHYIFIGV